MPTAPTPYDITPLPYFAYQASLSDWGLLLVTVAILFLVLSLLGRRHRMRGTVEAFALARSELIRLRSDNVSGLSKESSSRASLTVKRLLSSVLGLPLAQLAPRELSQELERSKSPALKRLLQLVIELDSYAYQPEQAQLSDSAILGEMISTIERFEQELRGGK
ncbi:MAG: hypothetical protein J0M12_01845 [Deltaproteobacteria bacterium]|nr:hypothetical protein [Deltaproteobacteria bacterium]